MLGAIDQDSDVYFSGLNGNPSSVPPQMQRRTGMHIKIIAPEIPAGGDNTASCGCPQGEDLFQHITKAHLGRAMTRLLESYCRSNNTVLRFVCATWSRQMGPSPDH